MTPNHVVHVALAALGAFTMSACATAPAPERARAAPVPTPASLVTTLVIPYPAMLRSANIEGQVIVDVRVDTAGRLDWSRSRVLTQTHDLFVVAVKRGLKDAAWRPATRDGERVAGLWRDTIDFVLLPSDSVPCPASSPARQYVCARAVINDPIHLSMRRLPVSSAHRRPLRDRFVDVPRRAVFRAAALTPPPR